jgi:hypothetical protein
VRRGQGRFFYMHQRLKEAEEATCDRALVDLKGLRHLKWLDQRETLRDHHKVPAPACWHTFVHMHIGAQTQSHTFLC